MITAEAIDKARLNTDLAYRVRFLRSFIGFKQEDGEVLNRAAPLVAPFVSKVVDAVYDHLFEYTITKEPFFHRNQGYEGPLPSTFEELSLDSEQIAFRKKFLRLWAAKVFTAKYEDEKTWEYLNKVGLMHTGAAAFKHREGKQPLHVDLMLCSALLGWVEKTLVSTILGVPDEILSREDKTATVLAVGKVLWIQNDLFQRHYIKSD
ncbi:hypothetical protein BOTBODRAFT_168677 [Botryobasidium botryosum FD-172 SS1]|uniref:Globin-sensor domain-containing protein n=1 Tax=Botryobasidium botryosum (strain FD-172 SS1) TaxID=930990 RepID=A0A067N383_BOTB1|nr:hypothetical protein BOTBODRAFT_168677 [Botryobasidium botryosum FD-172 SS1]